MPDKPSLKRLRAAAAKAGAARQSPLYRWMRTNHREFAAVLAEVGSRPNWPALAAELASLGLTDATDAAPTAKIARQTWWKVCQGVEKAARSAPPPAPVPSAEALPPSPSCPEAPDPPPVTPTRPEVASLDPEPQPATFSTGDAALDRALNSVRKLTPLPPMGKMDTHGRRKPTQEKQGDGEDG